MKNNIVALLEEVESFIYNFEHQKDCQCCDNNQTFMDEVAKLARLVRDDFKTGNVPDEK